MTAEARDRQQTKESLMGGRTKPRTDLVCGFQQSERNQRGESESELKQGIYRAVSAQTQTIYHTGTRRGPTEASVRL